MSTNAERLSKRDRKRQYLLDAMEGRVKENKPEPLPPRQRVIPDYRDDYHWNAHAIARSILS